MIFSPGDSLFGNRSNMCGQCSGSGSTVSLRTKWQLWQKLFLIQGLRHFRLLAIILHAQRTPQYRYCSHCPIQASGMVSVRNPGGKIRVSFGVRLGHVRGDLYQSWPSGYSQAPLTYTLGTHIESHPGACGHLFRKWTVTLTLYDFDHGRVGMDSTLSARIPRARGSWWHPKHRPFHYWSFSSPYKILAGFIYQGQSPT